MAKVNSVFLFLSLSVLLIGCQPERPNVVLILVDDLGWTDLGCYGSDYYETPNIDRLAGDGVKFTNSYSTCTVCSPTRASIMTGKYPARLHLTDWIQGHKYPWAKMKVPDWEMRMDSSEITIAEAFQQSGYFTAHVGKWHLGELESDWPENHGFDINIGGWSKGSPHRNKEKGFNGYFSPYGNPKLTDRREGEYLTERLTEEVCDLIQAHKDVPFFINFWLYNVHMPLQAKSEKVEKFQSLKDSTKQHQNPVYAAMIEHTDEAVGRILDQLKAEGLYENTIILFASDNGGLIGGKKQVTSNFPLRHGKGGMYEGGVRIPTILVAKEFHNGGVSDLLVNSTDYYPTLLDLAGIDIPNIQQVTMDGKSLSNILKGNRHDRQEPIFWHYPHYHQEGAVPYSAIRDKNWKLIENLENGALELFDLTNDIGEKHDLSKNRSEVVEDLKTKLDAWREKVNAQFPEVNERYDASLSNRKK